jgi:hypothetical protein
MIWKKGSLLIFILSYFYVVTQLVKSFKNVNYHLLYFLIKIYPVNKIFISLLPWLPVCIQLCIFISILLFLFKNWLENTFFSIQIKNLCIVLFLSGKKELKSLQWDQVIFWDLKISQARKLIFRGQRKDPVIVYHVNRFVFISKDWTTHNIFWVWGKTWLSSRVSF